MPPCKVTYFFETNTGPAAGWSESFYYPGNLAQTIAIAGLSLVNNSRRGVLHSNYNFTAYRVADLANPRLAQVIFWATGSQQGNYNTTGPAAQRLFGAESPYDGVLMRLSDQSQQHHRMFIFRGIPEGVVTGTYAYLPQPEWDIPFGTFLRNYLGVGASPGTQWQLQNLAFPIATGLGIVNATTSGDGKSMAIQLGLQTNPIAPLAPGSKIKVQQVQFGRNFNRVLVVSNYTQQTGTTGALCVTRPLRKGTLLAGQQFPGGTMIPAMLAYFPITMGTPVRGAKRDTGRPLSLLRGRRLGRSI